MGGRSVFVAGGTGYLGRPLILRLLARGHKVQGLVRRGSENKLPPGAEPVVGNALDAPTFGGRVAPADCFVHLVGVSHPSPAKAAQFLSVDLASVRASVAAAAGARVEHFVYVSVAHPAPVMKAYQQARIEGEKLLQHSGLNTTVLRPWYVLGSGHRWPYVLIPIYWLAERMESKRENALRLGLVTHAQMLEALVHAVEHPCAGTCVLEVPQIKNLTRRRGGAEKTTEK